MNITGNEFLVDFGMAKAILKFKSETQLTFTILKKAGEKSGVAETVDIKATELRPNLFMVTWKEKSGTTVTQVHDYEKEMIYSNWTLPTGEFKNIEGTIKQLTNQ